MRALIVASTILAAGIAGAEPRYTIEDPRTGKQVDATQHRRILEVPRVPRVGRRTQKLEIEIEQKGNWRTRMYREHWLRDPLPRRRQPIMDIRAPNWSPPPVNPRYEVTPRDERDR